MWAGWMRPSRTSFSIERRAIAGRTESKLEIVTASGVSSTTTSTPDACSKARMLRPLRPMMRPFISSDGSGGTGTGAPAPPPLARARSLFLDPPNHAHHVGTRIALDVGQEQGLRFLLAHARHTLQLLHRLLVERVEFVFPPIKRALPLVQLLVALLDLFDSAIE